MPWGVSNMMQGRSTVEFTTEPRLCQCLQRLYTSRRQGSSALLLAPWLWRLFLLFSQHGNMHAKVLDMKLPSAADSWGGECGTALLFNLPGLTPWGGNPAAAPYHRGMGQVGGMAGTDPQGTSSSFSKGTSKLNSPVNLDGSPSQLCFIPFFHIWSWA